MIRDITVCLTYFRSLTLANLRAALYSLCRQDLSRVYEIVIVDNNTTDDLTNIQAVIDECKLSVPTRLISHKHGDSTRTHSWSTNVAVRESVTPWVFFTRADYILDFNIIQRFLAILDDKSFDWNGFVTGNVYHLTANIYTCEETEWRSLGPQTLQRFPGAVGDYMIIDAGVWMARRAAFESVGGLDESLNAWGHAQTHFQYKLYRSGVEFHRIPGVLFYHPQHEAPRDLNLAHRQLQERGINLKELWARHDGVQPY